MLMWLVCNVTAVLCRRLRQIPETLFLNRQGCGLGKGLTPAPYKNAAVLKPWQQKIGCSAIEEEEEKGFLIKICML